MQAPTFLHMIEIDLTDFRKCPCKCIESHTWAMNITDHHTKHVTLYPLTAKSGEKYCRHYKNITSPMDIQETYCVTMVKNSVTKTLTR